ncbi:Potassium voltage-gated channel subfamily KQT member 1 [Trichinella pseudospiralis]|uniref:Potassium voltage-gated channel subfamily KQT member 1 n=1 Tax=Trichinella pseudospiralis TaxID=6337 RepID=A0A0V0YJ18_TRIPS|nr:Potassium voltage-gated channel subfamily KQT member 1 [Trichinella pseudospiralis]
MLNNKLRVKDVRWILYQCFECPKHVTHIVVHLAVCVVVVASLVINLLIETAEAGVDDHLLKLCLFAIELTLAVYFLGEILLRLWVIGIDHRFRGWRGKLRYMSSLNSLVDLTILSTTLLLCHVLDPRNRHSSRQELQNLIFVHLLRFLHLDRSGYTWNLLKRLFLLHRVELIAAAFLSSLTLLCIATVLAWWQSANNRQQLLEDGNSSNFPSAFYLTVVMYTTIGYGDYTPEGWFGKVFTRSSKQSFKRSKQSADLVDVSVKMNESETIQLSRLVNLQQKLEMSLGTQAARPEMSVSQRLGRLQHTVLSLHKQTDAVKSSLQTIRDHLKNTTI